jgi:hypothetical protein
VPVISFAGRKGEAGKWTTSTSLNLVERTLSRRRRTTPLRQTLGADVLQDNFAVALTGPSHGPHAVDHRRLDLDEALAPIALHRPLCRALGQRRGDGVIGFISKGDANHLPAFDPG